MSGDPRFLSLFLMSRRLGLPEKWLKAQAEAGILPHLKIGRRLMFDPEMVEQTITALAANQAEDQNSYSRLVTVIHV